MAQAILDSANHTVDPEQDWLDYVVDHMLPGCPRAPDLGKKCALTFLTFDFDSIVETRLQAIRSAYRGCPDHELQQALSAIRVLHLHGSLPSPHRSNRETRLFHTRVDRMDADGNKRHQRRARLHHRTHY
jgi:hypothetical protein